MHGLYVLLACLLSCLLLSAAAPCETAAETNQVTNLDIQAEPGGFLFDDTWMYTGYTYGGVTFAIPKESNSYELTDQFREAGIVLLIGNDDFCLQLRKFDPEVLSYEQFKEIIQAEPTAETRIKERNGKEVFIYRNMSIGHEDSVNIQGSLFLGLNVLNLETGYRRFPQYFQRNTI